MTSIRVRSTVLNANCVNSEVKRVWETASLQIAILRKYDIHDVFWMLTPGPRPGPGGPGFGYATG